MAKFAIPVFIWQSCIARGGDTDNNFIRNLLMINENKI
jgi:hypothetical protein